MSTPHALAERPSHDPYPTDEFSLAALLDLFDVEDPAGVATPLSLRAAGARAFGWVHHSSRRAASWGAVGSETTGVR